MGSKLEYAVWSHDTGLRISCFDRCQLTITWMFNIEDVRSKLRKHYFVARHRHRAHAPPIHASR